MPAMHSKSSSRPHKSYISSFIRWLQLKKYQYEVTFSLYMLTSTEKFIFNFILLVLVSMLVTAATMYLPNHVAVIYNRIWYYVHGEFVNLKGNGSEVLKTTGASAVGSVTKKMMMAETVETVMRKLDEL